MSVAGVGFAGLGRMGSAMARNLVKAGFSVHGYDVLPARRAELEKAGGIALHSLSELDLPVVIEPPAPLQRVDQVPLPLTVPCLAKKVESAAVVPVVSFSFQWPMKP